MAVCTHDGSPAPPAGNQGPVFVFFSNRLGCLGSLALSVALTALLLLILRVL